MTSTTTVPPDHRLSVLVGRVRTRLEEEAGALLWSVSDEDLTRLLADLYSLQAQVAEASLAALREADRRELGKAAGASSTGVWLSDRFRVRPEEATRSVKLARDLDAVLPLTQMALRAGEISADHAGVVARTIRDLPREAGPEVRAEAEQVLVEHARTFDPKHLDKLGRTVLNTVDPDLADQVLAKQLADDEAKATRQRAMWLHDDPDGSGTMIGGRLDRLTADMLRSALEPLAAPRPTTADGPDRRNASERLADGFAELLRRYLDSGESPSHGGEKPHLVITISFADLRDGTGVATLLSTGSVLSARTVQHLACDAKISWFGVHDGDGEVALSDGTRLFTGKLRRLLELRDCGCAFPGCNRPPAWCDAHHVIAWSSGGPTTLGNGVLLCRYHHRLIHQGHWKVRIAGDGIPEFTPPDWLDNIHGPLRNNRFRT